MASHLIEGCTSMCAAYGGVRGWCNKGDRYGHKSLMTCCCCEYALKCIQCSVACVVCHNVCWLCCSNVCCESRANTYLATKLPLAAVVPLLRTGDIILFSSDNIVSKIGTNSRWTHVNMIYRPNLRSEPYCFEVTLHRWLPTRHKGGAQLVPFMEKIETYDVGGRFAWRRLRHFRFTRKRKRILRAFFDEVEDKPYQVDMAEMMYAGFGMGNEHDTLESMFCSEAIAEAYKRLGLLPADIPSNRYTPADFGTEHRAGQHLNLLGGARLAPEVEILRKEDIDLIEAAETRRHHLNAMFMATPGTRDRFSVYTASLVMNPAVLIALPFVSYRAIANGELSSEDFSTGSFITGKVPAGRDHSRRGRKTSRSHSASSLTVPGRGSSYIYDSDAVDALLAASSDAGDSYIYEYGYYTSGDGTPHLPHGSSSSPAPEVHFAPETRMTAASSSSGHASPLGSHASSWSSDSHVTTKVLQAGSTGVPAITTSAVRVESDPPSRLGEPNVPMYGHGDDHLLNMDKPAHAPVNPVRRAAASDLVIDSAKTSMYILGGTYSYSGASADLPHPEHKLEPSMSISDEFDLVFDDADR
ncbi:uncharacterized protein AMSG_06223 [Thecamonas trahens ATCC 50062]|uniref:Uncharacterized protein n=1 Tax=Thecamonas trahens ATCC 50062 TaxID=461836 RepID=A0A0L0DC47_THETB|nr:hypothetical protein AMSG_06223 [Thecamonas trahens ATCC 50062]KNC49919.1 hypothetical protein AMSG_06223 [Thecamonas trahens ATCC 50062]|eukprot:XP_013757398.1 hypothetical protein AMSG_06223 [Thecamonas trahens ATCC 50062]